MWEIRAMTKHLPEPVRRRQILDAARHAFVDKGYFPTRMEDIAQAAGLSKGGLYCHFDSKRRIFEALVEQEYEESSAQLKRIAAAPGSYQERFARLGKHFMDFFRQRPDYPRFFMVMGEMAGREESIRTLLAGLQQEYIRALAHIIQTGIDEGVLKPVDPEASATLLKGMMDAIEGYMALGLDLDTEQLMSTGLEIVLKGLLLQTPSGQADA